MNNYIVIILKKRIGGNYAPLLDDFSLESSENLNSIFLRINSADSIAFKLIICSVIFLPIPTNHHFEAILLENVKIKINNFGKIAHYRLICQHGSLSNH